MYSDLLCQDLSILSNTRQRDRQTETEKKKRQREGFRKKAVYFLI